MKILIAVSEDKLQLAVSLLASPPLYTLRCFADPVEAVLSVCRSVERNDPYRVIVIDMDLRGWDEVPRFARTLGREMGWRCEQIFISRSDNLKQRLDAAGFGAAAYLHWPERAEDLRGLIKALGRL